MAQGLAKVATPNAIQEAEKLKKEREEKGVAEAAAFESALQKTKDVEITIEAKANEQGGLFRAISVRQIITALRKEGIKAVDDDIKINTPIKSLGIHEVAINRQGISGKIKIIIKAKEDKGKRG